MNLFSLLSEQENKELLKFPAYISILAANSDDELDEAEKRSAIKFAHTKTFTCDPLLYNFYQEADKEFGSSITELDQNLPKEKDKREAAIKKELAKIEKIVSKLSKEYSDTMFHSMASFTKHGSKAHHNVFVDFIFPVPVEGLEN